MSDLRGPAGALCLCACLLHTGAIHAATPGADQQLHDIVENYFEEGLVLDPVFATQIGDNRYNDRFPNDLSPEWRAADRALEERALKSLEGIDAASLSEGGRLTYDVFKYGRSQALRGFGFPRELLPIDQFNNGVGDFVVLGSGTGAQPFKTREDYENFIQRMAGFEVWVNQAITNMREGVTHGVVQPRPLMQQLLPQLRALVPAKIEDSILYGPLKSLPAGLDERARASLVDNYRAAISRCTQAIQRLADYIEKDYLPKTRSSVAWTALPNGDAWYAYRIARFTTTQMSAAEIHELGLKEVARIESEMNEVRRQVAFAGDLHAFFRFVQNDPRFYYTNADDLLTGYRDLKRRIDALLPKEFADSPKADYEIRAVEPFRAKSSAGAFYQRPSADGSRPGIFYVNTYDLKACPRFGMETLSLHEASPGHHFQLSIQQELTDLPRFRRFEFYVAYAEGWALYAESIGKELGLFTDPYQYYGRLNDEMLRAMRLVVDTGLHSKGWTRVQAIRYMLDHSSMAESDATAEVERYIAYPAQALGYKVGQLRISAMRARAEAALGRKFDIKGFHSVILRDGALPMDVLDAKVDRWIEHTRSSQ
ncbi:MAG TPA: DUF885 domain-containing protein [Steroidobacteraceae bacterium]|nr:DUF885 domain-containing protein [Steroidobacteraceae bacterium]